MNWLCEQLFCGKHLSSSVERRKAPWSPDTLQYAHLNSAVPRDSDVSVTGIQHKSSGFCSNMCLLSKSHSYSQAQEITDHLPYSAFLDTLLTLIHVLFCSLLDVFCSCLYLYQSRAAAQMKMLCFGCYWSNLERVRDNAQEFDVKCLSSYSNLWLFNCTSFVEILIDLIMHVRV